VVTLFGAATGQGIRPTLLFSSPAFAVFVVLAFLSIIALNALFVASEAALNQLKGPMAGAYKQDDVLTARLNHLLSHRDRYIAGVFMGSMTMRAWLIILCFVPAYAIVDAQNGTEATASIAQVILWTVALSIPAAGLNVLVGELIPKSYATTFPVVTAGKLYGVIRMAASTFFLPTRLAVAAAGFVTHKLGAETTFAVTKGEEEIKSLIETYGEAGQIEEEEVVMLDSVFDFGDTIAREVMTPRVDVDSISLERTVREAATMIEATGHSRLPVYRGTDDQILGIVHAKDIMRSILGGGEEKKLSQIALRPAVAVPESQGLHDLLDVMRQNKAQMVIVQDEYGGTSGIVTIEDVVEEVMGEIVDEYDDEEPPVVPVEGGFLVDAKLHLDDVNEEIGSSLSSEEFDTLGGYVFGLFGRQPQPNETISSASGEFTVIESSGRRILKVKVTLPDPDADPLVLPTREA
jgi:putative hemolysin